MTAEPRPEAPFVLGARRGLEACASARGTFAILALDHRQNLRKELRPADPESCHLRRDGRVQAGRRPGPRPGRDRDPARPGGRGGPVHRRRLAPGEGRPPRRDRGDRLHGSVDRPGQPRARRLERGEGKATGCVGGEAPRLLPPGRDERRRPGAPRRRRRRRLPGGGPRPVRRAAVVLDRRRQAADWRGAAARRCRDGAPADRDRRRRAQGRIPVRRVGHGSISLDRGLRGARRGVRAAVGAAIRRRRRGDLRGAGRDCVRGRRKRRGRRPVRLGRCGDARPSDRRDAFLRTTATDRLRGIAGSSMATGRPWHERANGITSRAAPGDGWYRDY